jgi:hypothetical protein
VKPNLFDTLFSYAVSVLGVGVGVFVGYLGVSMALSTKADASGWVLPIMFLTASVGTIIWFAKDILKATSNLKSTELPASDPTPVWAEDLKTLQSQVRQLELAGVSMAPGRTVNELIGDLDRRRYLEDPYGELLAAYADGISDQGWNFDFEALSGPGDYAAALQPIVDIVRQPDLVTDLSDDFDIRKPTCTVSYTINGQSRELTARVNNDWVDETLMSDFLADLETHAAGDAHFCFLETGGDYTLFFVSNDVVEAVNKLRPGAITP